MIEMLFSKIGNTVFYMQNGYDRVVEKAIPRPPAELDFKASIKDEQKVGVAVGAMLENNKADAVSWVRDEVKRAAEEREAWEQSEEARRQQQGETEGEDAAPPSTALGIFLQPGDSEERKLALFKDKHLRLLLTALGYQRLGVAEDMEASWLLPTDLTSAKLHELHAQIQQAEFDPPTFDGQSATDMTKPKGSYVRRETTGPFGDASDDEEGASDAGEIMFPPNLPEKRKQRDGDEEAPKKKRRLQRKNAEDPTESEVERRAQRRKEKERERNAKYRSKLFVTASDDESDEERDAEFFRLEEQRRQKQKGVIRNQLLQEMHETGTTGKGKKAKKSDVKAKAKEVAKALGEDEDDLIDEVVSDLDEDVMDEDANGVTSPARTAASAMDTDVPDEPVAVADDEDEDDAPVSKRPPARRLRAGFVLDDSDSDE
jgi:replication fork protection complex subunit Tof1/Swi1